VAILARAAQRGAISSPFQLAHLVRDARINCAELHLALGVIEIQNRPIRDDDLRSLAGQARRERLSPPLRWPGLVIKSNFSTKARRLSRMIMKVRCALVAISQAPPLPGSRVFGLL
jgi:hypothetical protein